MLRALALLLLASTACTEVEPEPTPDPTPAPTERTIGVAGAELVVRTRQARLDLPLGGTPPTAVSAATPWSSAALADDGAFAFESLDHGVAAVAFQVDGDTVARALVPSHPSLLPPDTIDAADLVATAVYLASPVQVGDPVFTAVALERLRRLPETQTAAALLTAGLASDARFLEEMDPAYAEALAAAHTAHMDDLRAVASDAGMPDPFEPLEGEERSYTETDGSIPGVFTPGDRSDRDRVEVTATLVGPDAIQFEYRVLNNRWSVVRVGGSTQYLAPTKFRLVSPAEFILNALNFWLEGMFASLQDIFSDGPEFDPIEHFSSFVQSQLVSETVESNLVTFDEQSATLRIDGPGCYGGCLNADDSAWLIPALLTAITEIILPVVDFLGNAPPASEDREELSACVTGLSGIVQSSQGAIVALLDAVGFYEARAYDLAGARLADAILALVTEGAVWQCMGYPPLFEVSYWAEFLEDQLDEYLNEAFFTTVNGLVDSFNLAVGLGQVLYAIPSTATSGSYDIDLSSLQGDDDDDDDAADDDDATPLPEPVITGLLPGSVSQGGTRYIEIFGSGFADDGSDLRIYAGPDVPVLGSSFEDSGHLVAALDVGCAVPAGVIELQFAQPWEPSDTPCSSPGRACWTGLEVTASLACVDGDGDGSTADLDCDDADPANLPGNAEACDGQDNDCDGATWASGGEVDGDGDGSLACADCDDADPANFPGNIEVCDGQDNNCDGAPDPSDSDADGDGFTGCDGDCDDAEPAAFPGAPSACDGIVDNNCDAVPDPNEAEADGDGWTLCDGDCDDADPGLTPDDADADGSSSCDGDCDDLDPLVGPGEPELCSGGLDEDCDLLVDGADPDCVPPSWTDLANAHLTLVGESNADSAGDAVAAAGDVDGDGLEDLLVGAYRNTNATGRSGKAYLLLGSSLAVPGSMALADAHATFTGIWGNDAAGSSVAGVGDVDGDGLDDILIGALDNDAGGSNAGAAYLFFGSSLVNGGAFSLADADVTLIGEAADDRSAYAIAGAGDVDGDGAADLLIGGRFNDASGVDAGTTYLFFAPTLVAASGGSLSMGAADVLLLGEAAGDWCGVGVAGLGDLDGDQRAEIVVGSPHQSDGGLYAGKSYVFLGSALQAGGVFGVADAHATLIGEGADDIAGWRLAPAADVDGDGVGDLLLSATSATGDVADTGAAYVVRGSDLLLGGPIDLASALVKLGGEVFNDQAGYSVVALGDIDGDGLGAIAVGASSNDEGGNFAGKAYLFSGATLATGSYLSLGAADESWVGASFGRSVGGGLAALDVNGDGRRDLVVAASGISELYVLIGP